MHKVKHEVHQADHLTDAQALNINTLTKHFDPHMPEVEMGWRIVELERRLQALEQAVNDG